MGDVRRSRPRLSETEVRARLEEFDVDAPRVGIVMGSASDMEKMQKAAEELQARNILHELLVMSAHREPDVVAEYAKNAQMRGPARDHRGRRHSARCRRGRGSHRRAGDRRATVGPPQGGGRLDAILSIVQMPPGVPVACVGLDNARNAAILAAQILRA